MDARIARVFFLAAAVSSVAATVRSPNFVVTASTADIAREVAQAAEENRSRLAVEWLGYELPRWAAPCDVQVKVGHHGAGGVTTFNFVRSGDGETHVVGWKMSVQGSLERVLDSVIPHEVSHTIFACHFRRALPRWADEGAATLAEHESEKQRQVATLNQVLKGGRRIPLKSLVKIKEYPRDMQDVMTLYAEGYSLAECLVQLGGKRKYLAFLADAETSGWDAAIRKHYDLHGVDELEQKWTGWVLAGSPALEPASVSDQATPLLASRVPTTVGTAQTAKPATKDARSKDRIIIRAQTPNEDPFLASDREKLAARRIR
jgi:hypothetical protein